MWKTGKAAETGMDTTLAHDYRGRQGSGRPLSPRDNFLKVTVDQRGPNGSCSEGCVRPAWRSWGAPMAVLHGHRDVMPLCEMLLKGCLLISSLHSKYHIPTSSFYLFPPDLLLLHFWEWAVRSPTPVGWLQSRPH